jgi:hypothetical protein
MSGLAVAIGVAILVVLLVLAVAGFMWYRGRHPGGGGAGRGSDLVSWANAGASGEMRSKLYPSANYRCCTSGEWACTHTGCGAGAWAPANTCGPVTRQKNASLTSSC